MMKTYFWIAGSFPFIILGILHLYLTFFTQKLSSRSKVVNELMKTSTPVLTPTISMWNAWVGFNASHSSGAIYIGLINLFVAIQYPIMLSSPIYLCLNLATVLFYLWLAKTYWFSIPFTGILLSACCYLISTTLILYSR
jgi:hypothetical protein